MEVTYAQSDNGQSCPKRGTKVMSTDQRVNSELAQHWNVYNNYSFHNLRSFTVIMVNVEGTVGCRSEGSVCLTILLICDW